MKAISKSKIIALTALPAPASGQERLTASPKFSR